MQQNLKDLKRELAPAKYPYRLACGCDVNSRKELEDLAGDLKLADDGKSLKRPPKCRHKARMLTHAARLLKSEKRKDEARAKLGQALEILQS